MQSFFIIFGAVNGISLFMRNIYSNINILHSYLNIIHFYPCSCFLSHSRVSSTRLIKFHFSGCVLSGVVVSGEVGTLFIYISNFFFLEAAHRAKNECSF